MLFFVSITLQYFYKVWEARRLTVPSSAPLHFKHWQYFLQKTEIQFNNSKHFLKVWAGETRNKNQESAEVILSARYLSIQFSLTSSLWWPADVSVGNAWFLLQCDKKEHFSIPALIWKLQGKAFWFVDLGHVITCRLSSGDKCW